MSPTRRYVLAGLISIGGLSGCLSSEQWDDERLTTSANTEGTDTSPTVLQSRRSDGEPIITQATEEQRTTRNKVVNNSAWGEEITIAPGVSDADRKAIRTFLDETEYDSETVFIADTNIESCYRYNIQSISWEGPEVRYSYCRELRTPDESCVTGTRDTVGLLFRIPAVLSSSASLGMTSGSWSCRNSTTTYDQIDANATVPGNTTAIETSVTRVNDLGDLP